MTYTFVQAKYYTPGVMAEPRALVVHFAEGGGTVSWLTHPTNDNSSHFVIEYSGRIVQMVKDADASHSLHVGRPYGPPSAGDYGIFSLDVAEAVLGSGIADPNCYIFAVEIEGYAANGPNAEQATSLAALVHDLHARHPSMRGLLGHRDFQNYKACPGGKIPWAALGGHGLFLKPPETSTSPAVPAGDSMATTTITLFPKGPQTAAIGPGTVQGYKWDSGTGVMTDGAKGTFALVSGALADAYVAISGRGTFVRFTNGAFAGQLLSGGAVKFPNGDPLALPVADSTSARDAANAALDKVASFALAQKG